MTDQDMHAIEAGRQLDIIPLADFENEPRARDVDIAEKLGFERPRDIRKLIERNLAELEGFGFCATVAQNHEGGRGRPSTEYWLNEEQALLVASVSAAPNASKVRSTLIRVFVAWRRGHLVERKSDLESLINEVVERRLASDSRVAVLSYVTVRQILDADHKVPAKGRRSLQQKVFRRLSQHCLENGVKAFRSAHSGTWLFPPHEAGAFVRKFCGDLIADHLSGLGGQGRLHLIVSK